MDSVELVLVSLSGAECCRITVSTLELHVSRLKAMVEQRTGIPWADQELLVQDSLEPMQDMQPLCKFYKVAGRSQQLTLVRRQPNPELLGPSWRRRIQNEILECAEQDPCCSAAPIDNGLLSWHGTITGPEYSVYDDGIFSLEISIPDDYPFKAPKVRFLTKIFHCNVNSEGITSLDILYDQWTPYLSIVKVMQAIRNMLAKPNPREAMDLEVARAYVGDRTQHDTTAREWVRLYAT